MNEDNGPTCPHCGKLAWDRTEADLPLCLACGYVEPADEPLFTLNGAGPWPLSSIIRESSEQLSKRYFAIEVGTTTVLDGEVLVRRVL